MVFLSWQGPILWQFQKRLLIYQKILSAFLTFFTHCFLSVQQVKPIFLQSECIFCDNFIYPYFLFYFRTAAFIVTSSLYLQLLVAVCIALFASNFVTSQIFYKFYFEVIQNKIVYLFFYQTNINHIAGILQLFVFCRVSLLSLRLHLPINCRCFQSWITS